MNISSEIEDRKFVEFMVFYCYVVNVVEVVYWIDVFFGFDLY